MLKGIAFFDSSQWVADRAHEWLGRWVILQIPADGPLALPPPDVEGVDVVGPGLSRAWRLEAECGLLVVLIQELQNRADGGVEASRTILVTPFRSEAEHALRHLPFDAKILSVEGARDLDTGWQLSRLDDNGQNFVIGCYPRRASADCMASLLGAGGHKQTYSVRLIEPRPVMVSDIGEWELWRADESGNSFLIARHFTQGHAQMQLDAMEAEPARHKQVYWISRAAHSA